MPKTTYLTDYRPPVYMINRVALRFILNEEATTVQSRLELQANDNRDNTRSLVLHGSELELVSLRLDGRLLDNSEFRLHDESLTIDNTPSEFTLEVETRIYPHKNNSLEGLYRSSGNFCTQCEAEGFRKITYFLDRPDVLARYTTTIEADKTRCPVLLSNGNLVKAGELPDNRHFAVWEDPFPKPSYLFALVAGDLVCIEDHFTTGSGRDILLQIYGQAHNRDKCGHAMTSLQKAMAWDEKVFSLEYDLDQYMIVAVDDFNMGAMENKGLNVFNSKYVLASPETATDADFDSIEAVIAHEYYHNWTGNRVTCRDWFQLSLKEGLTVFRDQQFTADMTSHGVKRINDVRLLRDVQFPEDNGPMAHPVRPASYIEINNFYTVTVYEKGAEVIRMLHTLLGDELFVRAVQHYLKSHDGTAATTDDFVRAMEEVSGRDLSHFRFWYSQAGTPRLRVQEDFDPGRGEYRLTLGQYCPPSSGQPDKEPLHIPVAIGLLDVEGREIPLQDTGKDRKDSCGLRLLELTGVEETFSFSGLESKPVLSLLRDFSAPVILEHERPDSELRFLMVHDRNPFSRWEAGQILAHRLLQELIELHTQGRDLAVPKSFVDSFGPVLRDESIADKAYVALLLSMPSERYLAEAMATVDVEAVHQTREFLRRELAVNLRQEFETLYRQQLAVAGPYRYDAVLAGQRSLKNQVLAYLMTLEDDQVLEMCLDQYRTADNMTDALGSLQPLAHSRFPVKEEILGEFAVRWQADPLVMDKWFTLQATAPLPDTLARVWQLTSHPAFSIKNPNRVRALIGAFAAANPTCFHASDGSGYEFIGDHVLELDSFNPQVAARLVGNLSRWHRFDPERQTLMRAQLERIMAKPGLSRDVYEVVSKSLA